jgi:hypothetical protein
LNNFVELHKDAKDAGDFQAAIKANELVGKHLGFFEKDNDQSKTSISINWAETKTYEAKH